MNKEIYFKIYTWMCNLMLIDNSQGLVIELHANHFVSIIYSDGDVQVNHYKDKEGEQELDGGGGCDLEEYLIEDMVFELDKLDIDSMQAYIRDKTDFIYELVFTG